jgi:amino acid adenylation domain-containing protein
MSSQGGGDKRRALLEAMLAQEGLAEGRSAAIGRRTGSGPAPLSFGQWRLWFVDQFQPESSSYNIPITLHLGAVDRTSLARALSEITRRHEILRTRLREIDGEPRQEVLAPEPMPLPVTEIAAATPEAVRKELERRIEEEIRIPFDMRAGRFLRARLIRWGAADHLLVLTLHHVAADGWSSGILLDELARLYEAFLQARPSPLPELPIQFADFATWQREQMQGDRLDQQLGYWLERLGDAPAVLELPTDRPRPRVQTFEGAIRSFTIPHAVVAPLLELGRAEQATLFMTLLAAFKVLLQRCSGQDQIVVGSPIANRTRPELEGLIGPFANTLALRTDLSGEPTFRDLLRRVRETALGAYAHQDLPFERIVEELQPERHLGYSPVFQVLFVLQNAPTAAIGDAPPEQDQFLAVSTGTAKFDLTLILTETRRGISAALEYDVHLFDPATAERLISRYQTLLAGAAADPDTPIRKLPLLADDELEEVTHGLNRTRAAWDDRCVHQLFESQVERTPEAVAVEYAGTTLTYRQLDRRANQLARLLRQMGVGPEVRVGSFMERSLEVVVALVAILKAGGVYTPLDPSYPQERLAFMAEDSRVRVILTCEPLAAALPPVEVPKILLDRETARFAEQDSADLENLTTPQNLAYVMYTSGSTGRPKGVAIRHCTMANLFPWQKARFRPSAAARTVQYTSLSFDVSFQEMMNTLCTGGVLVMMPEQLRREPTGVAGFLVDQHIERLFLPFTTLHHLCEAFEALDRYPMTLREIVSTGEQMRLTPPIRRALARIGDCVLHNQYGPTETHFATGFPLRGDPHGWPALPLVGRPLHNTRVYILDRHLQPVPLGVAGEVFIAGVPVARGYLERPRQTAEKFLPEPWFEGPDARMYRTGDLARFRPGGDIEYLGRMDYQVKVRGFRIELGEVEAILAKHPRVQSAVAVAWDGEQGGKRLVAYVVATEGAEVTRPELRRFLAERLPEYMVPTTFIVCDRLPLSPNGKVDRRALSRPDSSRPELEQEYLAPRDATEETLVTIWQEVLGVETIGVHDSFFDLGGHSLLATQVVSRTRQRLDVELTLRQLFEQPTIAALAALLREGPQAAASGQRPEAGGSPA